MTLLKESFFLGQYSNKLGVTYLLALCLEIFILYLPALISDSSAFQGTIVSASESPRLEAMFLSEPPIAIGLDSDRAAEPGDCIPGTPEKNIRNKKEGRSTEVPF